MPKRECANCGVKQIPNEKNISLHSISSAVLETLKITPNPSNDKYCTNCVPKERVKNVSSRNISQQVRRNKSIIAQQKIKIKNYVKEIQKTEQLEEILNKHIPPTHILSALIFNWVSKFFCISL